MSSVERAPARRKFSRLADVSPIEITDRDRAIIEHVNRHRLLRSTHIATLLGGGNLRVLQRRLAALYDHGYLERPRAQTLYDGLSKGSLPMIYAVGPQARRLIPEAAADPTFSPERVNQKNKTLRPIFFEHTLMVADVLVAVEAACRGREDIVFVRGEEILAKAPEATRKSARPDRLTVRVRVDGVAHDLAVVPDAIFALRFPKGRGEGKADTLYFFLEADRGTERLRTNLATVKHTNFYQKMVAYFHLYTQKRHELLLGVGNFRVLTVTTSGKRVDNLVAVNKRLNEGKGSRLFLFTHHDALISADSLLELPWRNGLDDKLHRLPD